MDDNPCLSCFFCEETAPSTNLVFPTSRGIVTIVSICKLRKDGIADKVHSTKPVIAFHEDCRKRYIRKTSTDTDTSSPHAPKKESRVLRSTMEHNFDIKKGCFLCGSSIPAVRGALLMNKCDASHVSDPHTKETVLKAADERNDHWASKVRARILHVDDLAGDGAVYHRNCYRRFTDVLQQSPTFKSPPTKKPKVSPVGRPINPVNENAFQRLCMFIEQQSVDDPQFSMADLEKKLREFSNKVTYSRVWLKQLLINKYGPEVTFFAEKGIPAVMMFRRSVTKIVSEKLRESRRKSDGDNDRLHVVQQAAEVIREDVRHQLYDSKFYPTLLGILEGGQDLVPESLMTLLQDTILHGKKGNTSRYRRICNMLSHAIISAIRPRSFVSPVLTGLAVHFHRTYGSRMLIDMLFNLGVCGSYNEAVGFETAITCLGRPVIQSAAHVQFVFDNADYNVHTLDGHHTFHALGGIMVVTPFSAVQVESRVPRGRDSSLCPGEEAFIPFKIAKYTATKGLRMVAVQDIMSLVTHSESPDMIESRNLDLLWMAAKYFNDIPAPGWAGFMEKCSDTTNSEVTTSRVLPLPFVNMQPSNPSTLHSALVYAAEETRKLGQNTCIITFDQPLYIKCVDIVNQAPDNSPLKSVVLRLGGFHCLMNLMGAAGHLMAGSGIEELFCTVFAKNTVPHLLSGKAFSRALRAHFLAQEALLGVLLESAPFETVQANVQKTIIELAQNVECGGYTISECVSDANFLLLLQTVETLKGSVGRTGKLWLMYFEMVELMRLSIKAERLGNWVLHLEVMGKMIPYFHSAGHVNYAKSVHLYVQEMQDLQHRMPNDELHNFVNKGFFTVRRTNKIWAGLWTDLTIEQVLMRNMKCQGGLTRGRGMSNSTIAKWIATLPVTAQIKEALEHLTGVRGETSEQHSEMREARQIRNAQDHKKFLEWLKQNSPFASRNPLDLVSLSTGIVADKTVNCEEGKEHGLSTLQQMININSTFGEVKLHRKNKLLPLSSMTSTIRVRDERIQVNVTQLFHRILLVCKGKGDDVLREYFKYELAPRPMALFDEVSLRKGTKSSLVPALEKIQGCLTSLPNNPVYVVDGGNLLHRVVWPKPATFQQVIETYCSFVVAHYGSSCSVVFDGYSQEPSTKDQEHLRRTAKVTSVDMYFQPHTVTTTPQSNFFNNISNKARFINLLSENLQKRGVNVLQAEDDADRLIVTTALELVPCGENNVVVVANDTDILVLLCALGPEDAKTFMLMPGAGGREDKVLNCQKIREDLGAVRLFLMFAHAFTGCDTCSALFKIGKTSALEKLKKTKTGERLREDVDVFLKPNASKESIAIAGEKFLLSLYGFPTMCSLDEARFILYHRKVSRQHLKSTFNLATLPPTSDAAAQHSYRVYHQIMEWMGIKLNPLQWGWKIVNSRLTPVMGTLPPAPQSLLTLVVCNCKSGCERNCECVNAGLKCSVMCGHCNGACHNQPPVQGISLGEITAGIEDENPDEPAEGEALDELLWQDEDYEGADCSDNDEEEEYERKQIEVEELD